MKAILLSFRMLIKHISKDGMLVVVCIAPILIYTLLYWVLPTYIEPSLPVDIRPYYLILDLLSATLVSYLLCFASSMTILEEIDENLTVYYSITPLGKTGYILSRLLIPTLLSALVTIGMMHLCTFTKPASLPIIAISCLLSFSAMVAAMLIIVVAKNKVEGMAMAKLSGLILVGLFIPFFITEPIQYLCSPLPTFWIAKLTIRQEYIYLIPSIACLVAWIGILWQKYKRKIEG